MASPFSMLGMLAKRRQAASKRTATTASVTEETASAQILATTTTTTAAATLINNNKKDTSDTRSIMSAKLKTRKPTFFSSRKASTAVETHAGTSTSNTPERSSTPINDPLPPTVTESPKVIPIELKSPPSDGEFSIISPEEKEKKPSGLGEGDWSDLEAASTAKRESSESSTRSVDDKKPTETKTVENAEDKETIQRLEQEKAILEADKARLAREMKQKEERWEADKARLVREMKEKEEKWEMKAQAEKLGVAAKAAKVAKEHREKEEKWQAERQAERLAWEAKSAQLAKEWKEREAQLISDQQALKAAFEAENAKLVEESKEREREWKNERVADMKRRDEEIALVERDNDRLAARIAGLETSLEETEASRSELEDVTDGLRKEKEETAIVIVALRSDISSALGDIKRLREEGNAYRRREAALKEELVLTRKQRDADLALRDSQIKSLDTKFTESRNQLEELREASAGKILEKDGIIGELRDQMAAYYQYVEETDRRNRLLSDQLKRQSTEIRFIQPAETRQLLQSTSEPVDAAVRLLNNFNSEVFQMAASFADSIDTETEPDIGGIAQLEPLIIKLAPIMNRDMVLALRVAYTSPAQEPNTLLLQIALQACMTYCANRFVNAWYPFEWAHGDLFQILYSRLLDTGMKEKAETWRATTKSLLRLTSQSHPQLLAYFKEHVFDVFAVVGRSKSDPAVEALVKAYEEKFSLLARLSIRLHILFNDVLANNVPCNLGTYIASPDSEFFSDHLEDCYPEGGDSTSDLLADNKVVCTAELGLQKTSTDDSGDLIVVRPKVVLSTVMDGEW